MGRGLHTKPRLSLILTLGEKEIKQEFATRQQIADHLNVNIRQIGKVIELPNRKFRDPFLKNIRIEKI